MHDSLPHPLTARDPGIVPGSFQSESRILAAVPESDAFAFRIDSAVIESKTMARGAEKGAYAARQARLMDLVPEWTVE